MLMSRKWTETNKVDYRLKRVLHCANHEICRAMGEKGMVCSFFGQREEQRERERDGQVLGTEARDAESVVDPF